MSVWLLLYAARRGYLLDHPIRRIRVWTVFRRSDAFVGDK